MRSQTLTQGSPPERRSLRARHHFHISIVAYFHTSTLSHFIPLAAPLTGKINYAIIISKLG